ncbi:hypothetical protein QJS10_CPB12g00043 [Acorus calamus]|uniref:Uncharacterized protein n=1 Tax=Acorus calamus TaxID=4465 RepID=A0AAV9DL25_ACOCL|nr:hypothetical protein QJS10_CPB12g00043 [Acorus calamus]
MAGSTKITSKKKLKYVNPMGDEVNHRCYMKYFRDIIGKVLDMKSKKISETRLLQKHFPSKSLHRRDVGLKLIELFSSKEDEDVQDFVRILIIFMFATFLLSNMGYACLRILAEYLDDLDSTWKFSWASVVHEMILDDPKLFFESIRQRDEGKEGVPLGYVGGCTTAVIIGPSNGFSVIFSGTIKQTELKISAILAFDVKFTDSLNFKSD